MEVEADNTGFSCLFWIVPSHLFLGAMQPHICLWPTFRLPLFTNVQLIWGAARDGYELTSESLASSHDHRVNWHNCYYPLIVPPSNPQPPLTFSPSCLCHEIFYGLWGNCPVYLRGTSVPVVCCNLLHSDHFPISPTLLWFLCIVSSRVCTWMLSLPFFFFKLWKTNALWGTKGKK